MSFLFQQSGCSHADGIASGGIMLRDGVSIVQMKRAVYTKEEVWQDHTISSYVTAFSRE